MYDRIEHNSYNGYMILIKLIKDTIVKTNQIAIFWLGQAGFVIKDQNDTILAIDPYLTDCCERIYGFKRLSAKLISPDQLTPDLLLISHHHEDHLDVEAVPVMAKSSKMKIIGSKTAIHTCAAMGINNKTLYSMIPGDRIEVNDIFIEAIFADHGRLVPDAIGFVIDIHGIRVYYSGDTAYRPEILKTFNSFAPNISILPINGAYGNLNAYEASKLAKEIGSKIVIPCHYWTFKEHCSQNSNPLIFSEELSKQAPQCKIVFMAHGEGYIYTGGE